MTLLSDHLPSGIAILDASVVINLLGCGDPVAVLEGLGHKCLIEQKTLREVRKHPIPGFELEPVLRSLVAGSHLEEVRMTDEEYNDYLKFVASPLSVRLDDGESAALAIAARGMCVILDERKARRRAAADMPSVVIASTLRLMLCSAHRQGWSVSRIRETVNAARQNSRMGVPREDLELLDLLLAS